MELSDRELIEGTRDGSPEATQALIRRHWGRCHRIAYLLTQDAAIAEDATQEAMLSALVALGDFDLERPLEPWLHRIVVNKAKDALRARERWPEPLDEASENGIPSQELELPAWPAGELLAAIGELRDDYRVVIALRYVLDFTPTEIAKTLEIPAPTVRTWLRRALIELRKALEPQEAT